MLAVQPVDLAQLRLSSMAKGIIAAIDDIDTYNHVARRIATLPLPLQGRMLRRFVDIRGTQEKYDAKRSYRANTWLRRTVARLEPRFEVLFRITQSMPLPWHILSSAEKTKDHASVVARECMQIALDIRDSEQDLSYEQVTAEIFEKLKDISKNLGVKIPFYSWQADELPLPALEIALLKTQCETWWARQLKTVRRQYIELLEIATGQVGKDLYKDKRTKKYKRVGRNPYASKTALREFNAAQASGREFLEMMELESSDGQVINLMDAVNSGIANPQNRRNELMLRIRETEELAEEMGYVGVFYTITTPGRFHANSNKYQGTTPKDAQAYLNKVWARGRAKLNRLGIPYFGVRVAEPHADATPHWHMLLFMPKAKVQWVNAILRWYFIQEDKEELYDRYGPEKVRPKVYKKFVNVDQKGVHVKYVEALVPYRAGTKKSEYYLKHKKKRQAWGFKMHQEKQQAKEQGREPNLKKFKEPKKDYRTFAPRFDAVIMDKKKGSAASYIAKYIAKNIDGYKLLDHEDAETEEKFDKNINPVLAWASTWRIRQFQFQGSPSVTVWRELRRKRESVDDPQLEEIRAAADAGSWKDYVKLQGGMCVGRDARFKPFYEHTPMGNAYGELVTRIKGVFNTLSESVLMTRLIEWKRQLKGTAEKAAAAASTLVGAADLSWTSGNNCTPLTAGDSTQFAFYDFGFDKEAVEEHKKDLIAGRRIRVEGDTFQVRDGQLQHLDEKQAVDADKRSAIEYAALVNAQKAERFTPNKDDWQQARELVNLAYAHANNAGRSTPIVGGVDSGSDYDYARQVLAGETEQEWWDVAASWG